MITSFVFGLYLIDVKNTSQLVFVEGNSISIVTEKFDFKKGEEIKIRIVNSGTTVLNFSDSSYGLKITGLSGILMYSPDTDMVISKLEPGDETSFSGIVLKLLAKSLVIFIGVGLISAFVFGLYLIDVKSTSQLVFVEGRSLSIVTEKFDFKKGEEIKIRIVNSGTIPLTFSDSSYGLKITGLSGILMYSPDVDLVGSKLEPGDEVSFSWDQIKNDGDDALEGLYKISVKGNDGSEIIVEKSTTVTIWK